eukprot:Pgem_evm1s9982
MPFANMSCPVSKKVDPFIKPTYYPPESAELIYFDPCSEAEVGVFKVTKRSPDIGKL